MSASWLAPELRGSAQSSSDFQRYKLLCAILHLGESPRSGHYTCFSRLGNDEVRLLSMRFVKFVSVTSLLKWWYVDDDKTKRVTEDDALGALSTAYILLYSSVN
jgi:uncharacterized UBP type Zn finger protein